MQRPGTAPVSENVKESEIRPEALLRRYLELSKEDADRCFGNEPRAQIPCVGCGSSKIGPAFDKHGFAHGLCRDCGTLYRTPRPALSAFEAFYRDSVSSNYWSEVFLPAVAEERREKIFKPKVEHLKALCEAGGVAEICRLINVGAGHGIFLEEWRKGSPDAQLVAVEPSAALAMECRAKDSEVVEDIVESVGKGYKGFADLVVCFEVLEHLHDPMDFLKSLMRLARPGGLVFVSTLCIDGFDLQTLWHRSNQISPASSYQLLFGEGIRKAVRTVWVGGGECDHSWRA